jgi:hypothetical protein
VRQEITLIASVTFNDRFMPKPQISDCSETSTFGRKATRCRNLMTLYVLGSFKDGVWIVKVQNRDHNYRPSEVLAYRTNTGYEPPPGYEPFFAPVNILHKTLWADKSKCKPYYRGYKESARRFESFILARLVGM